MKVIGYGEYRHITSQSIPKETIDYVSSIISRVKAEGDSALVELTERFDKVKLSPADLRVEWGELRRAYNAIPSALRDALRNSAGRIRDFQELQKPEGFTTTIVPGASAGVVFDPIQSVGVYVPGGSAAYPSTVLMTVIPAKVAGVDRCAVFTPPGRDGKVPDAILAAAYLAEADEVYRVGGAQAIAAMAYGTERIKRVEKIFGPGNIYVTVAKMLVALDVAVDMPAGPSELLVYTEGFDKPEWLAYDILAQAEHDQRSRAILVTTDRDLAERVAEVVNKEGRESPRREILEKSVGEAAAIVVCTREEGVRVINEVAPEHLELVGEGAEEVFRLVRNAGAVFIGEYSPVPLGDYTAGTNHVLPTMGWARRASPLSVRDFMRAREFLRCTRDGLIRIAGDAEIIATSEGLLNHARAVRARIGTEEKHGCGGG
ncbi:MAG: histidinol dehydrogenase [Candidatus Verstraetearchaeota archaeon]|nr:histidinol dehydrogenase [Candidatus Verstraetearchaeota archaeon]